MKTYFKGGVGNRRRPGKYDTIIKGESHDKQRWQYEQLHAPDAPESSWA